MSGENMDTFSIPETEREELAARARAEAARATASFAATAAGTRRQVNVKFNWSVELNFGDYSVN